LVFWEWWLVPDVLLVQLLGGEDDGDHRHLAVNLKALLAALDGFVGVVNNLRGNLRGLVKALHAALHNLGDVDCVVDGSPHSGDLDGVLLGLALLAVEESNDVRDGGALASVGGHLDLVLGASSGLLSGLVLANAAELLLVWASGSRC